MGMDGVRGTLTFSLLPMVALLPLVCFFYLSLYTMFLSSAAILSTPKDYVLVDDGLFTPLRRSNWFKALRVSGYASHPQQPRPADWFPEIELDVPC
jgi:hypothetical protein